MYSETLTTDILASTKRKRDLLLDAKNCVADMKT